ncbi:MAG: GNAT family N-acetyltransferase [Anaerolineae bacterium]|nr:GNAT family N-acetyltransferase [Anaerolineae bacterium]
MTVPDRLITTHLAMQSPDRLRPVPKPNGDLTLRQLTTIDVEFYLFLYRSVGEALRWRDRLLMPPEDLAAELAQAEVWVLYDGGAPAGYIELVRVDDGSVEVAYFGLRPAYQGRGLGKYLLYEGVRRAWDMGASYVHLHTCNLDGPYALHTYQSAGFEVVRVEAEPMPERYR